MSRVALLALCISSACGASEPRAAQQPAEPSGPVAARVDGEAIGLDEVRAWSRESGLPPREALARLVEERLLAHYASQRGYGDALADELERAKVQSLLAREVEAQHPPEDVAGRSAALAQLLARLTQGQAVRYDEAAIHTLFFGSP